MFNERQESLIDKLNKLAEIICGLQQLTVNLLSVCSSEQPDSRDLADLLFRRQQLITAIAALELTVDNQAALSPLEGEEALTVSIKLGEIRRLQEETGVLERKAKTILEEKRDRLKAELVGLRAGRAAGKAYTAQAPQQEGFFLDRREN